MGGFRPPTEANVNLYSWHLVRGCQRHTAVQCKYAQNLHDFAHTISNHFPGRIPPDSQRGTDDGSMHLCLGQSSPPLALGQSSPPTSTFLATGRVASISHFIKQKSKTVVLFKKRPESCLYLESPDTDRQDIYNQESSQDVQQCTTLEKTGS